MLSLEYLCWYGLHFMFIPIHRSLCLYSHSSTALQDEDVSLRFFRCDQEYVTVTIEIDRLMFPIFHMEVFIDGRPLSTYTCPVDNASTNIVENGTPVGRVDFPDRMNCSKAVIVVNPPPAISIRLSVNVNNGSRQSPYGPYYIGQESECVATHHICYKCLKYTLFFCRSSVS